MQCPNLIKMDDSFCVNSNMQDEYSFTYFFIFQNISVSLSQIIKYRREENCQWLVSQFQKLSWDLICALDELHLNNITHNDIRPCNIFYSVQKQCFVLGQFSNALKTVPNGDFLHVRTRSHPSFLIFQKQLHNQTLKRLFINHKRADIYSLGITLLSAFYMIEPIQRKLAAPINRKMQEKYSIMKILRKMVIKSQNPLKISEIKEQLQDCNRISKLSYLVESIRFRLKPKTKSYRMILIAFCSAYKRLGLWQQWRTCLYEAYQTSQGFITQIQQAEYYKELSRVEKILQNYHKADQFGQKAAQLYFQIGSKYSEENNYMQAFDAFNNGMETRKNWINQNKIVLVKILQSLALLHAQNQQFNQSMACLGQSKRVLNKTSSQSILDFYQIKTNEGRIHQIHQNFQDAQKVFRQLFEESKSLKDSFMQIQFLNRLGRNSIKKAQIWEPESDQISREPKSDQMVNQMKVSSRSTDWREQSLQRNKSQKYLYNYEFNQKDNLQRAEQYFILASNVIQRELALIRKRKNAITRQTEGNHSNQLEDCRVLNQSLQIQHLYILKYLGQIKYKQNSIERAQDFYYKILAQLDKILNPSQIQPPKHRNGQATANLKDRKWRKQGIVIGLYSQSQSQVDSRYPDPSHQQSLNQLQSKKQARRVRAKKSQQIKMRPKRTMSRGDLVKIKADVQCSIAVCKQHLKQYKQMLIYYNKSLASYKNYYGQYHNKLCGIVIGSMAVAYQNINQHNKAISCIQLANQIFRDILPPNSPDIRRFQEVRTQVIKDQNCIHKKLWRRNSMEVAQHLLAQLLSSTLGLKRSQAKKKNVNFKYDMALIQPLAQSLATNAKIKTDLEEIQEQNVTQIKLEQEQYRMQESQESQTSSLKQIQLPLKVTYTLSWVNLNQSLSCHASCYFQNKCDCESLFQKAGSFCPVLPQKILYFEIDS